MTYKGVELKLYISNLVIVYSWLLGKKLSKLTYPIRRLFHLKRINNRIIPSNENDDSLSMDALFMLSLSKEDRALYLKNLEWRRREAHEMDMAKDDYKFFKPYDREVMPSFPNAYIDEINTKEN